VGIAPNLSLESVASLDALREEWSELAGASRNVFATWEWASVWWQHFGIDRELLLTTCRSESGKLVAVIPLYFFASRPLRILRFLGHGPADELGPVCVQPAGADAARALQTTLADSRWDVFFGESLPADEKWISVLGARTVRKEASPVLQIEGRGWDDLLASWSSNLREQVRRRERRLIREHDVRFRLADDPGRLEADFGVFVALHSARWGAASAFKGWEPFHREFAKRALDRGWLRLWFLDVDGRPVAAWYGFRFAGVESYYQAGWDPAWGRESVGFILLAHSIREAAVDGMSEYRFLRGDERYKYRFADVHREVETIALSSGALGWAALGLGAAARHARPLERAVIRLARAFRS
jgi:CelD/BcsL family acetyltransferase involved in cellulose biosynthesis